MGRSTFAGQVVSLRRTFTTWGAWGDPRSDLALAIRPKENLFQTSEELQAFLDGYGTAALSEEEYEYFVRLYELF